MGHNCYSNLESPNTVRFIIIKSHEAVGANSRNEFYLSMFEKKVRCPVAVIVHYVKFT